jgi:hypothetical protein
MSQKRPRNIDHRGAASGEWCVVEVMSEACGLPSVADHDSGHDVAVTYVRSRRPARAGRNWHGGCMRRNTMIQTIAAVIVGVLLVLTAAGSCGTGGEGEDGDDAPGVTQQDDDGGGGDDDGGDD